MAAEEIGTVKGGRNGYTYRVKLDHRTGAVQINDGYFGGWLTIPNRTAKTAAVALDIAGSPRQRSIACLSHSARQRGKYLRTASAAV